MNEDSSKNQETGVANPPTERPLMVFDGDCNFCRHWIARWQRSTGSLVEYVEFQKLGNRFPEIARSAFEGAVQLIERDGRVLTGADAVFRLFEFGGKPPKVLSLLLCVPGFLPISRALYHFIAGHRVLFSKVTRLFFSKP
jgi:predicted DCC family thiol-disulfide oxidoreductase YuxK